MKANRVLLGVLAFSAASAALAGTPGVSLGTSLGAVVLGLVGGTPLPIVGGGLLAVTAVSLLIGVHIAKRKKNR